MSKLASGIVAILFAALPAPFAGAQNEAFTGFEAGADDWSINGAQTIIPNGGNPDAFLAYPDPVDTFGISLRNALHPAFIGDYGAKGDVRLELDVRVNYIQFFGSPVPRELFLILWDDDVMGNETNSGVYTHLLTLDGNGMPWTHVSADVTDPNGASLPAGWNGLGDLDPVTFQPELPAGSTWASVLAGIDRIEFTTFEPGFFYGFTNFSVGMDNVSISPLETSPWTDLGSALAGVHGDPALVGTGDLSSGSSNAVELSNAAASATTGAFVGFSAANLPFKGGTLVPLPEILIVTSTDGLGELTIPFTMPAGVPGGVGIHVQMGIQDGAAVKGVALSNAIVGVTP